MRYRILDWAGNPKISDATFETFEDAWECIYEAFNHLEGAEYEETLGEFQVVEDTGPKEYRFLDPKDPRGE